MSINVKITEKDGKYVCQSISSFDQWHFKNIYSVFNSKAEIISQYTDNSVFIKYGVKTNINPNPTEKRHFTAHLKEIKLFLGIDKKPELEEFDGYVIYDNDLLSKIVKAKIKIISDKRFEFKEEGFLYWQTVNMSSYLYHKANPELNKLYNEYQITKKRYNELEQKLKDEIYKKED